MNVVTAHEWRRGDAPCLSLGEPEAFDDAHLLAPFVALEDDRYSMWYSGSRTIEAERRVYGLGLATSETGDVFDRARPEPVLVWPEPGGSVLTPCLLRNADGSLCREDGLLRMWFSVTHFSIPGAPHTLHHASSQDGVAWSEPSGILLDEVYSPTVIRDGDRYRMWFVDVADRPWTIACAESADGLTWGRIPGQSFTPERGNDYRNYPFVSVVDGAYRMYFSYVLQHAPHKAVGIGYAGSADGVHWTEDPDTPLIAPTPDHAWESQYCGSPCIVPLPDGSHRMFYASRNLAHPDHKYYAICYARAELP